MTENLNNVAPIEDFDWVAYAEGETYSKENKQQLTESYDKIGRASCRERV